MKCNLVVLILPKLPDIVQFLLVYILEAETSVIRH